MSALGRFETVRVFNKATEKLEPGRLDYHLTGHINSENNSLTARFSLVHNSDNQIVWSHDYRNLPVGLNSNVRSKLVSSLATTLARTSGVVAADIYRRMPEISDKTVGYQCIIHASRYFETPTTQSYMAALACVERTLLAKPKDGNAQATFALLQIDGYLKGYAIHTGKDNLAAAARAAHEAIRLAPQSGRAHMALFMARFFDGRHEDAFQSAKRALEFNPYSLEIKSRVGGAYILRGEYSKGMALLNEVAQIIEQTPSWLEFYFFLHSYMTDDNANAHRHAMRSQITRTPMGILARVISSHRAGKTDNAARWNNTTCPDA